MRIKDLFTVPEGEKVTEKMFRRVLISSVCSILLCMTCLVSTTWAWFTVSIENTGNVIQIATVTAEVTITAEDGSPITSDSGKYSLKEGAYTIRVKPVNEDADPNQNAPVYIILYSNQAESYYFAFANSNGDAVEKSLIIGSDGAEISFSVSWVSPVGATIAEAEQLTVGSLQDMMNNPPVTETTEPSTEAETEPAETEEATEPSTEVETEPEETEEATEPSTEAETEPEETEAATEPSSEPEETTEETTESTETSESEGES